MLQRPRYFAKRGPQRASAQLAMAEGRSRVHRSLCGRHTSRRESCSRASSIAPQRVKMPAARIRFLRGFIRFLRVISLKHRIGEDLGVDTSVTPDDSAPQLPASAHDHRCACYCQEVRAPSIEGKCNDLTHYPGSRGSSQPIAYSTTASELVCHLNQRADWCR